MNLFCSPVGFRTGTAIHCRRLHRSKSVGYVLDSYGSSLGDYRIAFKQIALTALFSSSSSAGVLVRNPRSELSFSENSVWFSWRWRRTSPAELKRSSHRSHLYPTSASIVSVDIYYHTHSSYIRSSCISMILSSNGITK